jgi:hypothetical protein
VYADAVSLEMVHAICAAADGQAVCTPAVLAEKSLWPIDEAYRHSGLDIRFTWLMDLLWALRGQKGFNEVTLMSGI